MDFFEPANDIPLAGKLGDAEPRPGAIWARA
jgi:hypothetical protein